ncbi:Zn(II)2Cys6 transcription factor domain-containing protein [Aspergillus lucknowensis]|uniref:Zn(2)-C6 fungal-type domain-containing protein n=1 Tax=Aspergillus lucknowensis TaxID=176173 RepID=A0ABR4M3P2_9EURO
MPSTSTSPSTRRGPEADLEDAPSSKRRRVPLACRSCRERKVRCDGKRPNCSTCQRRGHPEEPCEYMVITETAKYQTERA